MSNFTNQLAALGVQCPKAILDAEEVRTTVLGASVFGNEVDEAVDFQAKIRNRSLTPAAALKELRVVGAAVAARQALKVVAADTSTALDYASRSSLIASADELYTALRPIVAEQGRLLVEAAEIVGPEPDEAAILRMGAKAGAAWGQHAASMAALRAVQSIVNDIATAAGAVRGVPPLSWIDTAQIRTPADLERANHTRGKFGPILAAGFSIVLNDAAEITATTRRIEGMTAAERAADAERKQAEIDANKADFERRAAMGVPAR